MKPIGQALALSFPLVLLASGVAAQGWVPVPCSGHADEIAAVQERGGRATDVHATWSRHEETVRQAKPGDPAFVPHPYPKSDLEIYEDFRYAFLTRLLGDAETVAPRYRGTLDVLQGEKVHYEIARVENWDPTRCRWDQPVPFYHLVRVFAPGGLEVSRMALYPSGLFAIYAPLDGEQGPLDDLSILGKTVSERFGIDTRPTRAQYASLSGLPVQCAVVMPCAVFKSEGTTYLVNHDYFLFALDPDAPRYGVLEHLQRPLAPRGMPVNAGREATPWITIGYGYQQGRLVAIGPKGKPLE